MPSAHWLAYFLRGMREVLTQLEGLRLRGDRSLELLRLADCFGYRWHAAGVPARELEHRWAANTVHELSAHAQRERGSKHAWLFLARPVVARWREDIEHHGVLQRHDPVRNVRRNDQRLAGAHHFVPAIDGKLQSAAFHHGDLLVVMAVLGNLRVFEQFQPRDGHASAVDGFARDVRIHLFGRYFIPVVVRHGIRILAGFGGSPERYCMMKNNA